MSPHHVRFPTSTIIFFQGHILCHSNSCSLERQRKRVCAKYSWVNSNAFYVELKYCPLNELIISNADCSELNSCPNLSKSACCFLPACLCLPLPTYKCIACVYAWNTVPRYNHLWPSWRRQNIVRSLAKLLHLLNISFYTEMEKKSKRNIIFNHQIDITLER